jgi:hypothetical protein
VAELLRPVRGGFLRPFGCAWFIWQFLLGNGPHGSPEIDPEVGAWQGDIFHHYKVALMEATAIDRATRAEERMAKRHKRRIDPENIEKLARRYFNLMPYKAQGCRFHSFVVYFAMLQRLGWVELTGREEPSSFQAHYPSGPPRRYYRLTEAGRAASESAWRNPQRALYGGP